MSKREEVKDKVSIPMYFYNIIVPQLGSYYDNYPVDFDARPVACCPLHDEETPSMRYYEETNSFYCFGCRRGGDVIALHRMFTEKQSGTKPTFDQAVDFLYDYFIKGNSSAKSIVKVDSLLNDEPLSTNVELARFSNYTNVLEGQLSVDPHIEEKVKRVIWKALDEAEILVSENKVNAIEAMNYIKGVVRSSLV